MLALWFSNWNTLYIPCALVVLEKNAIFPVSMEKLGFVLLVGKLNFAILMGKLDFEVSTGKHD